MSGRFRAGATTCFGCGAGWEVTTENGRLVETTKECVCPAKRLEVGIGTSSCQECGKPKKPHGKWCLECGKAKGKQRQREYELRRRA